MLRNPLQLRSLPLLAALTWSAAFAGPVLQSPGAAGYYAWNLPNLNQDGRPFWDNPTTDPDSAGIGQFIQDNFGRDLSYWGAGAALPLPAFTISSDLTSRWRFTLLQGPANGVFGIYDATNTATRRALFNSNSANGGSVTLRQDLALKAAVFGFYFASGGNFAFSGTQSNSTTVARMAAFRIDSNSWAIALERDFAAGENSTFWSSGVRQTRQGDYDDLIIRADYLSTVAMPADPPSEIPEPSTYAMIALGLCGIGLIRRCRVASVWILGISVTLATLAAQERHPVPLRQVPVPTPANLNDFIADRNAAIALGKALFWDQAVGSDGMACASCHFAAGADNRTRNQLSPGPDNTFTLGQPNSAVVRAQFPLHRLANPDDNASRVLYDTNDVVSSSGVLLRNFNAVGLNGRPDQSLLLPDPLFQVNGANIRRVAGRNSPSVINAVYNDRQFWDGRARAIFNGVDPFGDLNPKARVARAGANGAISLVAVRIPDASLASQAVGPPLSTMEMSFGPRTFPDLGKRINSMPKALPLQRVAPDDSVLGTLSLSPVTGLAVSYRTLITRAFRPEWWSSSRGVRIGADGVPVVMGALEPVDGPDEYNLMEYNFSLFFGLAVQMYEATLRSDDTPFDRYVAGDPAAMTEAQLRGTALFFGKANCSGCHAGAEFTSAAVSRVRLGPTERMPLRGGTGIYDIGFYNIGVRPCPNVTACEDVGLGGKAPSGLPLSFSRLFQLSAFNASAPPPLIDLLGIPGGPVLPSEPVAVLGAFKTPTLRNIELTAPYFHNGGQLTLRQVIDFYNRGGDFPGARNPAISPEMAPLNLTPAEREDLVAFLLALTDERVRFRKAPFDHPELRIPHGHDPINVQSLDGGLVLADRFMVLPPTGRNGGTPLPRFLP
jgi:cytochrome c peroxidase